MERQLCEDNANMRAGVDNKRKKKINTARSSTISGYFEVFTKFE